MRTILCEQVVCEQVVCGQVGGGGGGRRRRRRRRDTESKTRTPHKDVGKYRSQQGVRSCFGRAMLPSLFYLEIMLKRATFHFYCCVKSLGDIGDLAVLVTFTCDTCVWRLLQSRLLRAKGPMMCLTRLLRAPPCSDGTTLSHTPSFTHNISHALFQYVQYLCMESIYCETSILATHARTY